MAKTMEPIHPGEILSEEFLKPLHVSQYKLAKDINVPACRINEIVHGKRSITADTALRLSRYFGLSERFWLRAFRKINYRLMSIILDILLDICIYMDRGSEISHSQFRERLIGRSLCDPTCR